jgi:hypothetical protein
VDRRRSRDPAASVKPAFDEADVDAEFVFDRSLSIGDLNVFQSVLATTAPRWSRRLRYWKSGEQYPIDVADEESLAMGVLPRISERGPTYDALVAEHGVGPFERFRGTAELRGGGAELCIVLGVDAMPVSPLGDALRLGNTVRVQVRRARVEGRPAQEWTKALFTSICQGMSPAWAAAHHQAELGRR